MTRSGDLLEPRFEEIRRHFDAIAPQRARWKRKHAYYYAKITKYFRFIVPEGSRVLVIGSGDGELLAALKPSRGVGIDASPRFNEAARRRFPHLEFRDDFAESFRLQPIEKFDYVILSDLVGYLDDVQEVFQNLRQACAPSTRIVVNYYNYLWEPVLKLGGKLRFNMPQGPSNWLSLADLENLLHISGFETIRKTRKLLFPVHIPLVSGFANRILANLPLLRKMCLAEFVTARLHPGPAGTPSVSVVVPCKNEQGNIRELIERLPEFPGGSEMIFVDGRSTDGTREEILKIAQAFPAKNIRILDQTDSRGKGAAVRLAFDQAKGDALIILDGDISVAPEDMLKFYDLLARRTGEFINGTRMVYQMEKQAMRFLNILANKFFSSLFSYLLEQRIKDTLCGTKALYKSDYEKIAKNRAFFGDFDPFGDFDLLFGAAKQNLKIIDVPVRYHERKYGVSKIHRFRHGLLLLGMCIIAIRKLKFI